MNFRIQTRNVLFDLDGTLVDSLPGIEFSVDCALAECNLPKRSRALRPMIGPPIRAILAQLVGAANEPHLPLVERAFRSSYDSLGWSKTVPADNALRTLRTFHGAGLQLFIVTNKPANPTRQILEHLGIGGLFSEVVCRDSRTPGFSSKAEMLQHVIGLHQLEPLECLYVGDTGEDYRAATQVGLPVGIVEYGYGEPEAVYPGCIRLRNLSELLAIVETMEMS